MRGELHSTSSKDVPDVAADKPSPETLLVKALQSVMGKSDDDGKPKAKEAESIRLLDFPTPETYRSWRIAAREAIRAASDRPDEAFAWVQAKDQSLEGLRDPGKFLTLNIAKLLSAICKVVKGELARQIVNYKESEAAHARALRGRQVLYMFEQYFKTNEEVGALYSVEDLLKVSLTNDDLSSFIHNWESVIAGISHVPEELALRDIWLRQIRGSHRLKYDLETYDRAKEGTETHSYQFLLSSIKNLLTRGRVRKNRDKIAKAHGAKYGAPAQEDGEGKGKGGRKGREASRQRETSQVPKKNCFTWVKTGKCEKGADCKYKHEKPRGNSPNRGRTGSPRDLSKVPRKFHKIGCCTEGANCRFSRSKPASPAKGDKQRSPSPAKRRRSKRTSIEKTWDWRYSKLDSGLGEMDVIYYLQNPNTKKKKKKVSFINRPEIKEIPAEGEGWRHIPSPSTRINRFKTAQECPKGGPRRSCCCAISSSESPQEEEGRQARVVLCFGSEGQVRSRPRG